MEVRREREQGAVPESGLVVTAKVNCYQMLNVLLYKWRTELIRNVWFHHEKQYLQSGEFAKECGNAQSSLHKVMEEIETKISY